MKAVARRDNPIKTALLQLCKEQVKKPTHALTISFRQEARSGRPITADICAHTLRWIKIQNERKLFKSFKTFTHTLFCRLQIMWDTTACGGPPKPLLPTLVA